MMTRAALVSIGLLLMAAELSAQFPVGANGAVLFEKYGFDSGLAYSDVSEVTLPLTFSTYLGRRAYLTVSGGVPSISLTAADGVGDSDQTISGLVDTEARVMVDLIPDRLSLLFTAVAPTGMEALDIDEGPILSALSSEVIGFSTMNLGSGGRAGGGMVGAIPVGEMALGLAATYTHSLAYTPVVGQTAEWKPGGEIRVRAGMEGNPGPDTYLRVAGIFATRQKDQIDGSSSGGLGNQFHGYAALNQRVRSSTLTLYFTDSYRSAPQIEPTPVGAVRVPKGNLLALGAKVEIPVSREIRLIPQTEYRRLSEAPRDETGSGALESAGSTIRIGADLKVPLTSGFALVLEGNGLFGNVAGMDGGEIGVSGFRGGVHLELRR
jgi:hypothetical protein